MQASRAGEVGAVTGVMRRKHFFLGLRIVVALVFLALAYSVLSHEFRSLSLDEIGDSLQRIGAKSAGLSVLAAIGGFLAMSPYDKLALRYSGRHLSYPASAMSSTTIYAISNVLGFPVFTGNAVRFWLFEGWGLGLGDVAVASIVTTVVCNLALVLLIGVVLIAEPDALTLMAKVPSHISLIIGWLLFVTGAAATTFAVFGPARINIGKFHFAKPGPILLPHLAICMVDYLCTASVLYFPLSSVIGMDFLPFVALFATAKLVGIASNVPGGLGVFEAMMVTMTPSGSQAAFAAALIIYRLIDYVAPFLIASAILAVHALNRARRRTSPRQP